MFLERVSCTPFYGHSDSSTLSLEEWIKEATMCNEERGWSLMSLMEAVLNSNPGSVPNADQVLRDQFVEHVRDVTLRCKLKQTCETKAFLFPPRCKGWSN